jgi:hypothetical protein
VSVFTDYYNIAEPDMFMTILMLALIIVLYLFFGQVLNFAEKVIEVPVKQDDKKVLPKN